MREYGPDPDDLPDRECLTMPFPLDSEATHIEIFSRFTLTINDIAKESNLFLKQMALLKGRFQVVLSQPLKHCVESGQGLIL